MSTTRDERKNPVDEALELYARARVFSDPDRVAYIHTPEGDTWIIEGTEFDVALKARYYAAHKRALTKQEVSTVKSILAGRAFASRVVTSVCVRAGQNKQGVYLDLANDTHDVVGITAAGWRVQRDLHMPFRQPNRMDALPVPQKGPDGLTLRDCLTRLFPRFSETTLLAIAGFLIGALRPNGPFPLLQFVGGQGTSKSTTARMIKSLIDPFSDDERGVPRNEQDFAIFAHNCWVVMLGNVSALTAWQSDALCRISTGGAFGTRQLYSNHEEAVIRLKRPVILTGISDVIERGDLKDRTFLVELPNMDDRDRKTEDEIWDAFYQLRPFILASLCDCVSAGLANLSKIHPERLHRMADWHKFMLAAFPVMGFEDGLLDQLLGL